VLVKKICLYSTYSSFLVINVCNQGKTLCSLCIPDNPKIQLQRPRGQRGSEFWTKLLWKPQDCCDECYLCFTRKGNRRTWVYLKPLLVTTDRTGYWTVGAFSVLGWMLSVFSGPACSLSRVHLAAGKVSSGPPVTFIARSQMRVTYIWPWSSCRHLHLHHRRQWSIAKARQLQLGKYTMMYQSNTTELYYVYYCIMATCFDSYRIIFRPF